MFLQLTFFKKKQNIITTLRKMRADVKLALPTDL